MSKPPMICAVCQQALDTYADENGVSLVHTVTDQAENVTHEPVPVEPGPDWRGRCDFCGIDDPKFVVPARDFRMPGRDLQHSKGDWAACRFCALLISADRWPSLVRRAAAVHKHRFGTPMPVESRASVWRLHSTLRENITGPIRPLGGDDNE